jgi:hypothetical protein
LELLTKLTLKKDLKPYPPTPSTDAWAGCQALAQYSGVQSTSESRIFKRTEEVKMWSAYGALSVFSSAGTQTMGGDAAAFRRMMRDRMAAELSAWIESWGACATKV